MVLSHKDGACLSQQESVKKKVRTLPTGRSLASLIELAQLSTRSNTPRAIANEDQRVQPQHAHLTDACEELFQPRLAWTL